MTYQIKRYIDGAPTQKMPNSLPPIENPAVLKIIDHAIERNNKLYEQSTLQDFSYHNKR